MALGKEQIANGLRMSGLGLEEQAKDYLEQLNIIEEQLYKYCNPSSESGYKKVAKIVGMSPDEMYAMWCVNICSLLIMKKIPNDEMNGIVTMDF